MIDENEFVLKLGMLLKNYQNQMKMHSFRKKTTIVNEEREIICRNLLTHNDVSSILKLNYESNEKIKSMIND